KIFSKKEWFLQEIQDILKNYIKYAHEYQYDDVDDEDLLKTFLNYKDNDNELIDYIKSDLSQEISDSLTCINGVGGLQDEQFGIIQFINCFSDFNLKIEDFKIIDAKYYFKKPFNYEDYDYENLGDFFNDFIEFNAKKILDEIINFIN
ncbi:MAG: hypothetical protein BV456_09435, partial [Thermoplasmata archaeon M8B2D]